MKDLSEISVVAPTLYKQETNTPMDYGVLDMRLGISKKNTACLTCNKNWADCPGHFGFIDLEMPCFHTGFFKHIIHALQCICKSCSSFLLPQEKKEKAQLRLLRPGVTYVEKKAIKKQLVADCKKVMKCPNCGETNGVVKKYAVLKIVHLKYKHDKKTKNSEALEYVDSFENALSTSRDLPIFLKKAQEFLNPCRVLELFRKIPRSDVNLLLMDQDFGCPEDMILTRILVPPSCIRPTVESSIKSGSTEDDLTARLVEIIRQNSSLNSVGSVSEMTHKFVEAWDLLQIQVALFINGELTGIPKFTIEQIKLMSGVVQRLKGKQGRFRGNLSGKRVNFSARTVISPDPYLRIDQVGMPMHMAKVLTFPERVNAVNLDRMRQLVLNGSTAYPGAISVTKTDTSIKFRIVGNNYKKLARELKIGDVVDRNIADGDVVLFNRQPSLHRLSIQAFKVKVTKNRTLQFNECCCNPFNADFDGDEMNIHFPQTEEAKAEALVLMDSKSNIISPRNGEPLIAAIQDFITGAYLMTQKDRFFTKQQAASILSVLIDTYVELPRPAIVKPVQLWTGKQLFSLIMRPNDSSDVLINMRVKCGGKQAHNVATKDYRCSRCEEELKSRTERRFQESSSCISCPTVLLEERTKPRKQRREVSEVFCDGCLEVFAGMAKDEEEEEERKRRGGESCPTCDFFNKSSYQDELDPNDNFVVIHNSQLLSGYINKSLLGSGSKNSIFYFILRDFGKNQAADALLRLSKLTSWYLTHRGFSIGQMDVAPITQLLQIKDKLLKEGYEECNRCIEKFRNNELQVAPGCTEEQTLEGILLRTLSQIRDEAGNACDRLLPKTNSPLIMAIAGSKGSLINVCQMIVCVGQQSVNGKRVPNGYEDRSIYLFPRSCRDPASKGFVANSFYSGLTVYELFFHAVAGREGLVDTAVKTAETGYMQRRLVKAMEDLKCEYDGTVRNSMKEVVQFVYGSDGLDPTEMETKYKKAKEVEGVRPMDFGRVLEQICCRNPCKNEECLTEEQVRKIYHRLLQLDEYKHLRAEKLFNARKNERIEEVTKLVVTDAAAAAAAVAVATVVGRDEGEEVEQPERARNFGRHMKKFIESLEENLATRSVRKGAICQRSHITRTQLEIFLNTCSNKFLNSKIEPGTAVGAIAAQSIGEPGTQMTLKTFHFAGVASMNITQGVPRILEIINATKSISTPVAKCPLDRPHDESFARRVKGRIEKTTLGEITLAAVTTVTESDLSISIKIDLKRILLLQLEINVHTIKRSLLRSKLKLTNEDVKIISLSEIVIAPKFKENPIWTLYNLQLKLPDVLVCGIPTVKRVVIQAKKNKDGDARPEYELIVEGTNLGAIMTTPGVVGARVESNNIMEIKKCLGIEASRKAIMNEMSTTMANHGISVDTRHIMLLADTMTCKGDVMGVNRSGLAKNMESPLMLASFEKTGDHLFEAALMSQKDPILGVSEKIIMGAPVNLGTGSFKVLQKVSKSERDEQPTRMTLFDSDQFHLPKVLIDAYKNKAK